MDVTGDGCCASDMFYCPDHREIECPHHEGTVCDRPDNHVMVKSFEQHLREESRKPKETVDVAPHLERYMKERFEMGERRYGRRLHTNNGRIALVDAFEEAVDQVGYLAQALLETFGELPPGGGIHGE